MLISRLGRDAQINYEDAKDGGAGTGAVTDPPASGSATPTLADVAAELERTKAALKAANSEAQQRRLKLEAIEKAEQERKDQELSETQKAAKRAAEAEERYKSLEEKHRSSAIKNAVKVAAMAAGFADANDAVALADLSSVQVDDSDVVTGAKEAVEKLAKAKPHLLAAQRQLAPDINSGTGGTPRALTATELAQQRRDTDTIYQPF